MLLHLQAIAQRRRLRQASSAQRRVLRPGEVILKGKERCDGSCAFRHVSKYWYKIRLAGVAVDRRTCGRDVYTSRELITNHVGSRTVSGTERFRGCPPTTTVVM